MTDSESDDDTVLRGPVDIVVVGDRGGRTSRGSVRHDPVEFTRTGSELIRCETKVGLRNFLGKRETDLELYFRNLEFFNACQVEPKIMIAEFCVRSVSRSGANVVGHRNIKNSVHSHRSRSHNEKIRTGSGFMTHQVAWNIRKQK